jgi:hypothetical protein
VSGLLSTALPYFFDKKGIGGVEDGGARAQCSQEIPLERACLGFPRPMPRRPQMTFMLLLPPKTTKPLLLSFLPAWFSSIAASPVQFGTSRAFAKSDALEGLHSVASRLINSPAGGEGGVASIRMLPPRAGHALQESPRKRFRKPYWPTVTP